MSIDRSNILFFSPNILGKIEEALGFKLYPDQIKDIIGDEPSVDYFTSRATGKTTAYCIKLALSSGPPLNLRRPIEFSDRQDYHYSRGYFVNEFMDIRKKLSHHGFIVREVKQP